LVKLEPEHYSRVSPLIQNTHHELILEAVIRGHSPGEIYVDDLKLPRSTLILTLECNLVAGNENNDLFNSDVRQRLDFHEHSILCDTDKWEGKVHEIHLNIAIKKYTRWYYRLNELLYKNFIEDLDRTRYTLEYVYLDTLRAYSKSKGVLQYYRTQGGYRDVEKA